MKEFVEKLIERLEEEKTEAIDKWDGGASHKAYSKIIEIINQLAEEYVPETNVGKWIPCSQRLPEKEGKYLVCSKDVIWVANYFHNTWWGIEKRCRLGDVEAWQPLPEAYKPEQQKEIPTDHYIERFNRVM